ncbi:MAG: mannosyl-glycoprotein endo-beta-N-acetylglucosamidase, partial [Halieaceae bacterium]|nr:mannosyl-glycoprotein endo-beta-N-acetylglucosamidase [Halieaceae bacterium]
QGGIGLARALVEQMQARGYVPNEGAQPENGSLPSGAASMMKAYPLTQMGQAAPISVANSIRLDEKV